MLGKGKLLSVHLACRSSSDHSRTIEQQSTAPLNDSSIFFLTFLNFLSPTRKLLPGLRSRIGQFPQNVLAVIVRTSVQASAAGQECFTLQLMHRIIF
jgi:hypothetical protein